MDDGIGIGTGIGTRLLVLRQELERARRLHQRLARHRSGRVLGRRPPADDR
ncbi:hypothetical protein [Streptomyces sp. NPDC052496]|uniref:hypothetical protein n=1 Tax=Streptomyces sp. NPDC052496 TaxID=3154951 RepID=UPI003443EF93